MNKNKFYISLIVGLLIVNLVLVYFVTFQKGKRESRMKGPKGVIIERLGFDEEQQKEYSEMVDLHSSQTREISSEIRGLKQKLYLQLVAEKNTTLNDSLLLEISNKHNQLEKLNIGHFYDIKALCRDNQLELFGELTEDLNKLFHKGHRGRGRKKRE